MLTVNLSAASHVSVPLHQFLPKLPGFKNCLHFQMTVLTKRFSFLLSSGLWSPISNPSSPDFTPLNSFSAFGNSFNLTGGK